MFWRKLSWEKHVLIAKNQICSAIFLKNKGDKVMEEYDEFDEYDNFDIEELRKGIIDYYGSATPMIPIAFSYVSRAENMDDKEIIEEAKKIGLI